MRCFLVFALFSLFARAGEVSTLESLTSEWVGLRTERAREIEAWRDEAARLQFEIRLLQDEESRLKTELEGLTLREDEAETKQLEIVKELGEQSEAMRVLLSALTSAGPALREALQSMPSPLSGKLTAEEFSDSDSTGDPLQMLRQRLTLANQILLLQTRIHVEPLVIESEGIRREMEVVWIGSVRAFAVGSGSPALRGFPEGEQWKWVPIPEATERVRQAIRVAKGEAPPLQISLPLEVTP